MTRGGERGLWGNKNEPQLSLNIPPGQMGQVCKNSLPVDKLWLPGPPCRFLFRDPTGKCTQSSGASSLGKPFIPKNTHLAAVRCVPLPQKGYPRHPYRPWCLLFASKLHSANSGAKAVVGGSWRAVVLKRWLQSYLEGSLKQKPSGPIPRVSESVGLRQ